MNRSYSRNPITDTFSRLQCICSSLKQGFYTCWGSHLLAVILMLHSLDSTVDVDLVRQYSGLLNGSCIILPRMSTVLHDCCVFVGSSSCPSGWNPSGSNCYILRSSKKKWSSAESDCVKLVGHLATITSGSENAVVYSLRGNSSSSQDIWIGLNDKGDEGTFEWVDHDGTNTSYRKWYDGEPNGQPNDGDCVRMVSNGKWRDSSCSDEYYYVCQKPDVTLLPKCQSGWTPNGLSCYSRFTKRTKWDSAESDCKLRGGHLVSINSTSENSVVFSLRGTSSSKRSDIWIGLNDKDKKGSFVWIDGTRSSYTNWHSSEPDDSGDCVRMVSDGTWKDKSCSEKYQYVCEYQLTTPSIIQSTMNSSLIVTTIAATTGIQTKQPVATSRSVSTTTLPTQKLTPAPVTTPVTTKTAATTQKQPTTSATIDFFAKSYENATTASPDTASSLSSHNTQASTTLPLIPVTQFLASERAPTTAETGTGSASLVKQTSSKATTMYVGVGAAITVCGVLAVVVFLLVVWRRRKRIQSHLAGKLPASYGCRAILISVCHFRRIYYICELHD